MHDWYNALKIKRNTGSSKGRFMLQQGRFEAVQFDFARFCEERLYVIEVSA